MTADTGTFWMGLARIRHRARRDSVAQNLVRGAFWGLAAAAALLIAGDIVHLSASPAVLAAAAAVAGVVSGAAAGLARRIDPRLLLIRVDAALGSAELASTAFDLLTTGKQTVFAGAIVERASRTLLEGPLSRAVSRPRMPLLPFIPLLAACAAALAIFPVSLAALFPAIPAPAAGPSLLGRDLEGLGRRLEQRAAQTGEERLRELSRELQRIGREFQEEKIVTDDTLERLSDVQRQMEELGVDVQRMEAQGDQAALPDAAGRSKDPGAGDARPGSDAGPGAEKEPGKPGNGAGQGGKGGGGGAGQDRARGGLGGKGSGPGGEGPGGTEGSSEAGSEPAPQKTGEPSVIDKSRGPLARIPSSPGDGEAARFFLRAVPGSSASRIPETDLRRQYERSAESVLTREEIPPALREAVRGYFISIGILQGK